MLIHADALATTTFKVNNKEFVLRSASFSSMSVRRNGNARLSPRFSRRVMQPRVIHAKFAMPPFPILLKEKKPVLLDICEENPVEGVLSFSQLYY